MKKIRLFYIYFVAFSKRFISRSRAHKYLILGLTLGVFLLTFSYFTFAKEIFSQTSVSQGLVGTYTEKDIPEIITRLMSSGLINIDQSGNPVGNLVENWEVNTEATLYTLKLKKDLFWIDGTPLKAGDLNIVMGDVEVQALDDYTIQFKLADSFAPFPSLLSKPVFKNNTFVGIGPYQIEDIQKDQIFVKKLTLASKNKDLPKIIVKFYPNEKIAKEAINLGEVQSLLGLNSTDDIVDDKVFIQTDHTNYQQLVTIFYNTQDPLLSDENFRLALSFAAPAISGQTEALTSIPTTSWAFNKDVRDYLNNPDEAVRYLAKVPKERRGPITLTVTSFLEDIGNQVVESWKSNGINAVLRVESGIPQNFQALLVTQNIPTDPDQYSLWHSTQNSTNISKFSHKRIDKDLEDGRKIVDLETRKQRYDDFQKVLLDHAPATFLYFPKYNVVYMKKVGPVLQKVLELQLVQK